MTPAVCALGVGSSPLTRGKPASSSSPVGALGLIPTHAGKTGFRSYVRSSRPTHPRSCGENVVCFCAPSAVQGSSPLTRGKPRWRCRGHPVHRLIPAHAGKTRWGRARRCLPGAHPHSCGENALEDLAYMPAPGSSPLMRGKRVEALSEREPPGLIPTHAGKT